MWMRLNLNILLLICTLNVLSAQKNFEKDSALRHFMQGEYLLNQGNYAMAILELQDALQLDPNASTIHVSIADGYRKLGKYNRAESHLGIAIELNPEEIEAIEMLAQIKINKQDYSEAENLYLSLKNNDTFSDRLVILLFHFAFFLKNYKNNMTKKESQELFDFFVRQIELSIREIGYGDQSVNKKMKTYVNILYSIIDKIDKWER